MAIVLCIKLQMFRQTQSNGRFTQKRELLGLLERSTWQNNTGKKFANRNDFMHIATYLDRHCDRYVGYAVPGGHVLEVQLASSHAV